MNEESREVSRCGDAADGLAFSGSPRTRTGSLKVGIRDVECERAGGWRVDARGSAEPLLEFGLCSVTGGSWLPAELSSLLIGGCGSGGGTPIVLGDADLPAEMCTKFALGVKLSVACWRFQIS